MSHGLCAVLLGLCILHNDSSVAGSTVADLTNLVQKRLGSDMFIDKIGDIPKHEVGLLTDRQLWWCVLEFNIYPL